MAGSGTALTPEKIDGTQQAGVPALTDAVHKHAETERLPAYSVHMDAIRALAAFVVLASHAKPLLLGEQRSPAPSAGAQAAPAAAPPALGLGHHAVIVFFVLSGFLVGNSVWRAVRSERWSWSKYLLQRMTRLWTVLLPALAIGGVLDHLGMRFLAHPGYLYTSPPGQYYVVSNLAAQSTFKVLTANALFLQFQAPLYGTNLALWSLANEFWYYLAFPPLLLAIFGRGSWLRIAYLALALLILVFVGQGIAVYFIIWLLGFVVSVLPLTLPPRLQRGIAAVCALQFFWVNALLKTRRMSDLAADIVLGFSFSLLLYAIAHRRQLTGSLLYQRLAVRFAGFSYTVYTTHLPFLVFLIGLSVRPWQPLHKDALHYGLLVLIIAAAYLYAYVLYLLFERNTDRVRRFLGSLLFKQGTLKAPVAHRAESV